MLYEVQQEAARQEAAIENYKDMLAEVTNLRGDIEERLTKVKESFRKVSDEYESRKLQEKKLLRTIESLDMLQAQLSKWESELAGNLTISERISEKDAAMQRELLYQKQQRDFVMYKLEDEVWKLQTEIKDLDEQLQIKDREKVALSQTVADANADLECLEKEHKTLYNAWNSVLTLISQRDTINEEISEEQQYSFTIFFLFSTLTYFCLIDGFLQENSTVAGKFTESDGQAQKGLRQGDGEQRAVDVPANSLERRDQAHEKTVRQRSGKVPQLGVKLCQVLQTGGPKREGVRDCFSGTNRSLTKISTPFFF